MGSNTILFSSDIKAFRCDKNILDCNTRTVPTVYLNFKLCIFQFVEKYKRIQNKNFC